MTEQHNIMVDRFRTINADAVLNRVLLIRGTALNILMREKEINRENTAPITVNVFGPFEKKVNKVCQRRDCMTTKVFRLTRFSPWASEQ